MSDDEFRERLDRLESLVDDQQQATIEDQQETIAEQRERLVQLEGDATDEQATNSTRPVSRRDALKAGGLVGLLGLGAGTASADSQGQVGTSSDPLTALYTEEINGGVTGDTALTDLVGTDLAIDGSGALTATTARLDVDDGTTTVTDVEGITFGAGLTVTDDGDGAVTIDR